MRPVRPGSADRKRKVIILLSSVASCFDVTSNCSDKQQQFCCLRCGMLGPFVRIFTSQLWLFITEFDRIISDESRCAHTKYTGPQITAA